MSKKPSKGHITVYAGSELSASAPEALKHYTVHETPIEQGTPEWFAVRMGLPTASCFDKAAAEIGPRGGKPKGREEYMHKLIGEILTGKPKYDYHNDHMERGKIMEAEARDWYAMVTDYEPIQVGFLKNSKLGAGASPDSLIGSDGMLEIKTKLPHLQVDCLLHDALPSGHSVQVQGQLWVAEREWCDFVSYWPDMPRFKIRVYRDEEKIKKIAAGVKRFNEEKHELLERLRQRYAA